MALASCGRKSSADAPSRRRAAKHGSLQCTQPGLPWLSIRDAVLTCQGGWWVQIARHQAAAASGRQGPGGSIGARGGAGWNILKGLFSACGAHRITDESEFEGSLSQGGGDRGPWSIAACSSIRRTRHEPLHTFVAINTNKRPSCGESGGLASCDFGNRQDAAAPQGQNQDAIRGEATRLCGCQCGSGAASASPPRLCPP